MRVVLSTAALLGALCLSVVAQEGPVAFSGAKLIPISGAEIADGTLVVQGGRIHAIGPTGSVAIPDGATVRDVSGRVILPGLICTHSHVGQPSGGDSSSAIHPEARVLDSWNMRHASIQKAQAGGLTAANVMSGSGHLLSGQTIYVKLKDGRTIDDMVIRDAGGRVRGGMKMANGTNSQRPSPFPQTRAKSAALMRSKLVEARNYRDKIERAGDDASKLPPRDLGLEALLEVLDGRRTVHFHTHRHDDVLTVLRLREEFGFEVVLHHVSDGHKVAREIAAAGVAVSLTIVDSPGGKIEAADFSWENGMVLERAGVPVAIHTDDGITDSRLFLRSAALAVRAGMTREGALRALTLEGARILHLDDRIGSLEVGKDADFTVLSGDPFSVYTRVEQTWVEGEKVFDLADPQDARYAAGGWGAGDPESFHGCCSDDGGAR